MNNLQETLYLLINIQKNPKLTQRKMAKQLGFSLGKLNYCLKALQKKGFIKINNFKNNPKKYKYLYMITPKGFAKKTYLTLNFMKKKMEEYDDLKKELEKIKL